MTIGEVYKFMSLYKVLLFCCFLKSLYFLQFRNNCKNVEIVIQNVVIVQNSNIVFIPNVYHFPSSIRLE